MSHCSPNLTLNTYGHLMEGAEARAIATLSVDVHQICTKLSAADEILDASACEAEGLKEEVKTKKDLGKNQGLCDSMH